MEAHHFNMGMLWVARIEAMASQTKTPTALSLRRGFALCLAAAAYATRLMAALRISIMSSIWFFSTVSGGDIAKASPLWRR